MKHIKILIILLLATFFFTSCQKTEPIAVIPEPSECIQKKGHFVIDERTFLCFGNIGEEGRDIMKTIRESYPKKFKGLKPNLGDEESAGKNSILFAINEKPDETLGDEGYTLTVTPRKVVAKANTVAGLFYAYQTLVQMSYASQLSGDGKYTVPCAKIKDTPRFAYRGAHLDVSRHFFDVDYVKKYLDMMASYKLNKFHWHLTDDHGWRIQIDKYPALTSKGAWRPERSKWDTLHPVLLDEPATYGGFYTKDQVREIVAYAAARNIDVIPEIEIPGHCSAILYAYPQFACDDYPYTVAVGPYWPPKAIMCAGNDEVLHFYKGVLEEVAELFPYPYIHIGGDEAFNDNWQICPKCQQRIADKGLKDEMALQQWLMNEIEQYLKSIGKKAIIWDDIVSEDMVNKSTIMCWQGPKAAVIAANHGNDIILCPTSHCYFNFYQNDPEKEPLAMTGLITLEKAYTFDPMPEGLSEKAQKHILGGQCNLWTEFINTPKQADYMIYPRICALAECVWTDPAHKDWKKFQNKVEMHSAYRKK